jgi:tripartite-type tricarboxylate transporter receptor subunit TctC
MPAGVPRDIVRRVSEELVRGLKTPEMREKILVMGGIAVGNTPEEFAAFFHAESDKWYRVANAANVKLD